MQLFVHSKSAFQADIHGLQRVSLKGVARFVSNPIVIPENVPIRIKARIFCEVLRRLQRENCAETEIARHDIPTLWTGENGVAHEAVSRIVG